MSITPWLLAPMLAVVLPATAAEKRAFTIKDLYKLKGISGLSLSPDGSRLLFQVSTQDLKKAKRSTQIWMMDLGTGTSRPLTFAERSSYSPQWSKDGKTIEADCNACHTILAQEEQDPKVLKDLQIQ